MTDFSGATFNIIKQRGDPKTAITNSGHRVKKQEYVYLRDEQGTYQKLRCADYHNEHFLYIDPQFNDEIPEGKASKYRGWFAMCTCGAPAVIVGKGVGGLGSAQFSYGEMMLVCMAHTQSLLQTGIGKHATSDGRRWW